MNTDIIQIFSFLLSTCALISVFSVIFVHLYLKIRKLFHTWVNCWFCNTWTKVPYEVRNCFDCPNCLQYNGFNKDGSYNKVIEAQYHIAPSKLPRTSHSNGFCNSCNHNQQLKITQLANFTPLKEENYDIEVEHFRNQLEKAYQLCKHCAGVLRSSLLREKATVLGNHVFNLQKKGQSPYNMDKLDSASSKKPVSLRIIKSIQRYIAILLILIITLGTIMYNHILLLEFLPSILLPYYEVCYDLYVFITSVTSNDFPFNGEFSEWLATIGLVLQVCFMLVEKINISINMNHLLCWSFLTLTSWTKTHDIYILNDLFQVLCGSLILYTSFYEHKPNHQMKNAFQKIPKITNDFCDDYYSDDEFDTTSQYAQSYHSFSKDCYRTRNSSFSQPSVINSIQNFKYFKTDNDRCTANTTFDTLSNTARHLDKLNNTSLYRGIRSSLEDLHLDNSVFKIDKSTSFNKAMSSSEEHPRLVLSPSKLKTITQNSWVAGGFWRNEDGTLIPINEKASLSRSSSQSSGFGSQVNDHANNNFRNPFSSLPTSARNSVCGEADRFSLVSEPPYYFHPVSPQPTWTYAHSNSVLNDSSRPEFNKTFGNIHKSSTQIFNEFVLPSTNRITPVPLFSANRTVGLFKLPQMSPFMTKNDAGSVVSHNDLTAHCKTFHFSSS